jgi:hypothetical protein
VVLIFQAVAIEDPKLLKIVVMMYQLGNNAKKKMSVYLHYTSPIPYIGPGVT